MSSYDSDLTSKPSGEIFRYSLTSLLFNITFILVKSSFVYENSRFYNNQKNVLRMWARQILKKIIQFCLSGISKTQVVYLYQIKYIFMNTSTIIVCVYVSVLKKYILTSVTTEMIRKKNKLGKFLYKYDTEYVW